ncbi:MAG: UDP-glucose 4-epimerase GalE [Alphaproteobacteria bacterium]|nr:UDP-glucose 4-epimerase GalE [Alphaproteobacteria bacterium]
MTHQILVTGGAGYIGSHAVHHLIDHGYQPVVLDDFSTGRHEAIPEGTPLYEGNVGDPHLLATVFSEQNITAVMHFAGSIVVPESVTNPGKYYANNTGNTLMLLTAMAKAGVSRLVFSSTAAVYGNPDAKFIPIVEDNPTEPINPYGMSKLMSERMIADMTTAHDMSAVVLRYFNVAGADMKGRVGQSTPDATHLIKIATQVLTGQRDGMSIFGTDYDTPDGTCIRDYIHIDDLIAAHLLALDHLIKGGENLTLNCGYGHGFSVKEVITAINALGEGEINVTLADRRDGDPARLIADSSACRNRLGWTPRHDDLTTIVRSALAWEKSRQ